MKKSFIIIAALAVFASQAHASGNSNKSDTINQGGSAVANPVATGGNAAATGGTAIAAPVANGGTAHGGNASTGPIANTNTNVAQGGGGGQGGQGGQGGRGGDGGSVLGSGNSSSSSAVLGSGNSSNTNVLGQQQGQAQGQLQGQVATGVGVGGAGGTASSGSTSGASSTSGGNTLTGGANTSTQANAVTVNGDTVTYQAQERNPVGTAWAPNISPTALCALGVSGGAQGVSFGLSFGKAYIDDNCQLLEQIRATATVLGDRATAAEMMCDVPSYKAARARAGKPCAGAKAAATAAPVRAASSDGEGLAKPATYQGNDPIVMRRLGISN